MLPPIIHLREEKARAVLQWSIERMMQEMRDDLPGSSSMKEHLAHMMLLQALRMYSTMKIGNSSGWFAALADRQLGLAIKAVHMDLARRWTISELGSIGGMSRSTFATRFRETVGETPFEYISRWRMLSACDRLERIGEPVSIVVPALGYESESAFTKAFKRVVGRSPRQYKAQQIQLADLEASQFRREH